MKVDYSVADEFHNNTKLTKEINLIKVGIEYEKELPIKKAYAINSKKININKYKGNSLYDSVINRKSYTATELEVRIAISFDSFSDLMYYSYSTMGVKSYPIKTVPSAGAKYPCDLYIINFSIDSLEQGIYFWHPQECKLYMIKNGNYEKELIDSVNSYNQYDIKNASFGIAIIGNKRKTCGKYGNRGYRYLNMDIGYISQNLYLISAYLELSTRAIAGIYEEKFSALLNLTKEEDVFLLHLFGKSYKLPAERLNLNEKDFFKNKK